LISNVLLGVIVGILSSGTGLGGGFLVVPFLIYLGKTAKVSVGTSILYVSVVALSSLIAHYRIGNVDFKAGIILALGGIVGAQVGPHLLNFIPETIFKRGFGGMMVAVGLLLIINSKS
tara:strand:+ start:116 stop:469 length:354 start_codon:yes stop_codon:yes gene_type:complete